MEMQIQTTKTVNVTHLHVFAEPRYWGNTIVNGIEDIKGDLIPCRKRERWCPIINVDTGIIENWTQDVFAEIHYQVGDDGDYYLRDADNEDVLVKECDYVPNCLCPKENGCGDYIIMDVEGNGQIKNWKKDFSDFEN